MIARRVAQLVTVLGTLLVVACTTTETRVTALCTPNLKVYCRCQDLQEGSKTCAADGNSYGACVPCETAENPEVPTDPSTPVKTAPMDAGPDAETVPNNGSGPCGDGIVNTGEDCDVEDADPADGCDGDCHLSGTTPPATASCPGLDVHLWKDGRTPSITSTTNGGGSHRTTTACGASATTGATGTDRVFRVAAHVAGTLHVDVTGATYNAFVWASTTCGDSAPPLACANATNGGGGESLSVPVEAGHVTYVFVDGAGASNNAGAFTVKFSLL